MVNSFPTASEVRGIKPIVNIKPYLSKIQHQILEAQKNGDNSILWDPDSSINAADFKAVCEFLKQKGYEIGETVYFKGAFIRW